MRKNNYLRILLLSLMFILSSNTASANYDGPNYSVIKSDGRVEIRQYEDSIIAEVTVAGNRGEASNEAFFILLNFINGSNAAEKSVPMTSPVVQQPASQKIPMTSPVSQRQTDDGNWNVAFFMPNNLTLETTPNPLDERVSIKKIKGKKVAAIQFSGRWTDKNFFEHEKKLKSYLEQNQYLYKTPPTYAYYNAPFVPWFLRRNEVIFELAD